MPKHYQSGLKTIRGAVQLTAQEISNLLVFNYESADRTRAWIVRDAYIWVANPFQTNNADTNAVLIGNLATDHGSYPRGKVCDPSDNRTIGWFSKQYISRNGLNDFQVPNADTLAQNDFLIDRDRIVTNDLYLNTAYFDEQDTTIAPKIAWMVVLEEISISPSQSVLQQLKGVGQDI